MNSILIIYLETHISNNGRDAVHMMLWYVELYSPWVAELQNAATHSPSFKNLAITTHSTLLLYVWLFYLNICVTM